MSRILVAVLFGALFVGAAIIGVNSYNQQVARLSLEMGRQKLRAEYDERAGAINNGSNADRHREELSSLVKWYDVELSGLYNEFPGIHDPDGPMKEMQKLKPDELATKKEWYDEAKTLYDSIEKGKYAPLMTAVQEGVRIDLLSLKRATYEGKNRLRMDVVIWGAPRREVATKIEAGKEARAKQELDFGFRGLTFEFVDDKEKLLGGGNTGAPTMTVDYPERWIPDFPPQVAMAIWYVDPFPAETKNIDLKMAAEIKSPTMGSQSIEQEWKLVAQPDWLIRPGETFEGEERVMAPDELDRSGKPKPHARK
jgi:hypothetical protein